MILSILIVLIIIIIIENCINIYWLFELSALRKEVNIFKESIRHINARINNTIIEMRYPDQYRNRYNIKLEKNMKSDSNYEK